MRKIALLLTLITLISIIAASTNAAISRVPRRFHMVRFFGNYSDPHGSYSSTAGGKIDFGGSQFKADRFLDNTWSAGAEYGVLFDRSFLFGVGFRYTSQNVQDWLQDVVGATFDLRDFDLEVNLNYMPFDITANTFSPFLGLSVQAGVTQFKPRNFSDEWNFSAGASINFGADAKVYEAPDQQSFLTIAADNRYDIVSVNDRPRYLHLGLSLKYYYK